MSCINFDDFLASQYGITDQVYNNLHNEQPNKPVFFQPFSSKSDPLCRLVSVVTAPIAFFINALKKALYMVLYAFKSVFDLMTCDPSGASVSLAESYNNLLITGISLLAAITSPIINALGFIGGGIACGFDLAEDEKESHSMQ